MRHVRMLTGCSDLLGSSARFWMRTGCGLMYPRRCACRAPDAILCRIGMCDARRVFCIVVLVIGAKLEVYTRSSYLSGSVDLRNLVDSFHPASLAILSTICRVLLLRWCLYQKGLRFATTSRDRAACHVKFRIPPSLF